jgi:trehalose 6-phosphate phosphatase
MPTAPDNLDPDTIALFLDVDGTLLGIRDNPADVSADDALIAVLGRCFDRLGKAMALISGRSVAEVDRIFAPAVFPVAGAHGTEIRELNGKLLTAVDQSLPDDALAALEAFVARHDGLLLERKRNGVSLHYRKAPSLQAECRQLVDDLLADLGDAFRLIAGKMVFEIAPRAHDKGAAIRAFLEKPPFTGREPVFIGDDVTDEDGFRVVNEIGGLSIRVGDITDSEARFRLADVDDVQSWLRDTILADEPQQRTGETRS